MLRGEGKHRNQKNFQPSNTQKEQNEQQEHGKIINNFKIFNNNFYHSNVLPLLMCVHFLRQRIKGLKVRDGEGERGITMMKKHGNTRTYV